MALSKSYLQDLHEIAQRAEKIFEGVLSGKYPRADKFTWFRACEAAAQGRADEHERKMANDSGIESAYKAYMDALHAYYYARDGARGVLGGRGL